MVDIGIKKQTVNPGSVLVKRHTIPVTIKKFYTDVDGVVIDKNTIPAAIQKKVPVFLLGDFDRQGGYRVGLQSVPPEPGLYYLMTFVNGNGATSANVVGFTGVNTIQQELKTGDIIQVYTDDLQNPSYFIWVVIQNTYASIASIVGNMESTQNDRRIGPIVVHAINYNGDNDNQLSESIRVVHFSNIGTWKENQIEPLGIYRTPYDVQIGLVRMQIAPVYLDQYLGLNFNMLFETDKISFDFLIKTVNNG